MYTLIALAKHYLDRPNARFHPIGVCVPLCWTCYRLIHCTQQRSATLVQNNSPRCWLPRAAALFSAGSPDGSADEPYVTVRG
jgi:hypothetical protein